MQYKARRHNGETKDPTPAASNTCDVMAAFAASVATASSRFHGNRNIDRVTFPRASFPQLTGAEQQWVGGREGGEGETTDGWVDGAGELSCSGRATEESDGDRATLATRRRRCNKQHAVARPISFPFPSRFTIFLASQLFVPTHRPITYIINPVMEMRRLSKNHVIF